MKNIVCVKCLKKDSTNSNEDIVKCNFCGNELNVVESSILFEVDEDYLKTLSESTQDVEYSNKHVLIHKLAMLYDKEKNYDKAYEYNSLAAAVGNNDAKCELANCYYHGDGCKEDKEKAASLYKEAALQGVAEAQCSLAYCLEYGYGIKMDKKESFKYYSLAVEQKLPRGYMQMGMLYEHGRIVKKDYNEAVKWYKMASAGGNSVAQNQLGNFHYSGTGVKQDYTEAFKYYKMAADGGDKIGQLQVAIAYSAGRGVNESPTDAFYWMKKSAEQKDDDACYFVGSFYESGYGVAKDKKLAYEYYKKAADLNHEHAKNALLRFKNTTAIKVAKTFSGYSGPAEIEIDLENIISFDSHLEVLKDQDDIRIINKNMSPIGYSMGRKYGYSANVLIVGGNVDKITNATFNNVNTLVYLGDKGFPSLQAFKTMKVNEVIFINAGFLKGSKYLIEGCQYVIENFDTFNDKENFIAALKKKTDKIKQLVIDLSKVNYNTSQFLKNNNIEIPVIEFKESNLLEQINLSENHNDILLSLVKHQYFNNIDIDIDNSIVVSEEKVYSPTPYSSKLSKCAQTLVILDNVEFIGSLVYKQIENVIYLSDKAMPSFNFFKKYRHDIKNVIFINSEFLKKDLYLIEGCKFIINNFNNFFDKENFIKTLQKKSDKINRLIQDIFLSNDTIMINFLIEYNIVKYDQLLSLSKLNVSSEIKVLIIDAINNCSEIDKKKYEDATQRKEDVKIGFANYTLKDLKVDYTCTKSDQRIYLSKYKGSNGKMIIPANVDGLNKYEIKHFGSDSNVEKIYFEEGIIDISLNYDKPKKAFSDFKALREVYLPSTLEHIDESFLKVLPQNVKVYCKNKDNPNNIIQKGDYIIRRNIILFINNKNITTDFVIPEGIEIISAHEFAKCRQINSLILPQSLKEIGEKAFYFCTGLKELILPPKLEVIKDDAFKYCSYLIEMNIPSTVHTVGKSAFLGCQCKVSTDLSTSPIGWNSDIGIDYTKIIWKK